jgi:hypothetical protein
MEIDLDTFEYNKIIWIAQFFISTNEERRKEIENVIRENCANPEIDEIHLLNEEYYDLPILNHSKIRQINLGKRMSYYDAFFYSQENLEPNNIKILSNNDITFNEQDLRCLRFKLLENKVLCLTRYEYENNKCDIKKTRLFSYNLNTWESASQDTWIYKQIIPSVDMDIQLGTWACDNRIAYILKENKYQILNNSLSIRTYHHHFSNYRTYNQNTPPGKRSMVKVIIDPEIENIREMLFQ